MKRRVDKPTGKQPSVAKIARPVLTAVHDRVRLFTQLDESRKSPVVWISAPAGAGKTTLVASYIAARKLPVVWYRMDSGDNDVASFFYYLGLAAKHAVPRNRKALPVLTGEYLAGLSTFTVNFFRELFARLPQSSILVLDNCQDIETESAIQDVLRWGLEEIPQGITVIVMSRQDPPPGLARLRASGRVALVGWEELRLAEDESKAIVKLRHKHGRIGANDADRLYRDTQGWVAGLVLLTERNDGAVQERLRTHEFASQAVFDYFASEIFRRNDPVTRQFLLKTAFLSKILPSIARGLTEELGSETILHDLTQRNYFTTKHIDGSYEYHPLFRAFLVSRARAIFTDEQVRELKQRSAKLLADAGNIETAVELLQEAEDWLGAVNLVLKHAATLLSQGRTQTLGRWLTTFPDAFRIGNPWILYWLGTCRLAFAPVEARGYLEQAFVLFERQTDASPLYLAWARIIESFLLEMHDYGPMVKWLDRYSTLKNDRVPPAKGIENASIFTCVLGLVNARPDHPDLVAYAERAEHLFQAENDPERKLARAGALLACHSWKGNVAKVGSMLDALAPHPRASAVVSVGRLNWYVWKTLHDSTLGRADDSLRTTNEGIALAEASGIHALDLQLFCFGIWGQLCVRNVSAAQAMFRRLSSVRRHGQGEEAIFRHYAALIALHEGDTARAIVESRRAVELANSSNLLIGVVSCQVGLAYAYARQGNSEAALQLITEGRAKAHSMQSKRYAREYDFCEAVVRRMRGEYSLCMAALRSALALAEEMGAGTPAFCLNDDATSLYAMALEADIHTDYVRSTIVKLRLAPPPSRPEKWPWRVRIYTFGRFVVVKDDKAISFRGKAQKRPLELLRALIAFGGRNVAVPKLAQTLWPHTDGDTARTTLRSTLRRLRELIGEQGVTLNDSHLSLNPDICWLDVWAFEKCVEEDCTIAPFAQAKRLVDLYGGEFLDEDESAWALIQRERLHALFLRTISKCGEALEGGGNWADAASVYESGIALAPLSEDIYRHLMDCYRRLDRIPDALAVYHRCRCALKNLLHIDPSAQTQALYREIESRTQ
jgi:LuxR family transcriptional regulator, maltose regulon positive regulatory protein